MLFAIRSLKSEIPNITGYFSVKASLGNCGGAFYSDASGGVSYDNDARGDEHYQFDASSSCDRYGNYTEVNPLYLSCHFYLKY